MMYVSNQTKNPVLTIICPVCRKHFKLKERDFVSRRDQNKCRMVFCSSGCVMRYRHMVKTKP